jgi:hypothetical protein
MAGPIARWIAVDLGRCDSIVERAKASARDWFGASFEEQQQE